MPNSKPRGHRRAHVAEELSDVVSRRGHEEIRGVPLECIVTGERVVCDLVAIDESVEWGARLAEPCGGDFVTRHLGAYAFEVCEIIR